jgi:isopenicillin N synthase-like dioxygenase
VTAVPVIDLGEPDELVAAAIDEACRTVGFFSIVGHGVDPALADRLDAAARAFFARPDEEKAAIAMTRGGRAWRGWFPLGGELTAGVPDGKEGVYFGAELAPDHPRVADGTPLHGANLFPARPADLGPAVLVWLEAMTALGHRLVALVGRGMGLAPGWFDEHLTGDPTVLFRIFRYPPAGPGDDGWGVAEHTDYGLLTILHQDDRGGLEVRTTDGWAAVPPHPGAFVVNLGDMLERLSDGRYRSTPHRVRNPGADDRLSLAFFFDPAWDADVRGGTYGEYLLAKVARVFPALFAEAVPTPPRRP